MIQAYSRVPAEEVRWRRSRFPLQFHYKLSAEIDGFLCNPSGSSTLLFQLLNRDLPVTVGRAHIKVIVTLVLGERSLARSRIGYHHFRKSTLGVERRTRSYYVDAAYRHGVTHDVVEETLLTGPEVERLRALVRVTVDIDDRLPGRRGRRRRGG